jgi:hypothetical protein
MRIARFLITSSIIFAAVMATAQQASPPQTPPAESASNAVAPPLHPATEDQIREYLAVTGVSKATHELVDTIAATMQSQAPPYLPPSFWADMRAEFAKLDVVSTYVPIYQRYISQADMQAVIDFYRSPAGKNLLAVTPMLGRDAKAIMQEKGKEIGLAVYSRHKDEIDSAKKLYDAQHGAPAK